MEQNYVSENKGDKRHHMMCHAISSFCITPKQQDAVLAWFETPEQAVTASNREWTEFFSVAESFGFTEIAKNKIKQVLQSDYEKDYDRLKEEGISFVTREDAEYPEKLRTVFSAPRFFYYKGALPGEAPCIAIVGARNCTGYGSGMAGKLAYELAEQGVGIISGLAYGVDKAAHDGALRAGGSTFAVMGCGIDICYPSSHKRTYEQILSEGGGIMSEYPPGTKPLSWFFPQRNRIIAGLSDGVLVTEARQKSGSLITVSFGLEYGKSIYAVPGRVDDMLSDGCNFLLKEGAKPVTCSGDILEDLFPDTESVVKKANRTVLTEEENRVYKHLTYHAKHVEQLLLETRLSYRRLVMVLDGLTRRGYAVRQGQAYYGRLK